MTEPLVKRDEWRTLRPYAAILVALWIAEITGSFEAAMIMAAMKYLILDFGDPAKVGWLVTSYLIVGAAAAALVGRLGDLFGRRRLMCIVLSLGIFGSMISALSHSFALLLTGRILQGMTAAILPLAVGLVRENLPRDHVPIAIGLLMSGASLGTAAGLIMGGWIADNFSWHGVFVASVVFCAVTLLAVLIFVPKSPLGARAQNVDWFSGILFAPGVMLLLFYVGSIAKSGLDNTGGLAALGAGLVLLAIWLWRSLSSPEPLLDVRQFGNRSVLVANVITALVALGALQVTLIFTMLLQGPVWTGLGLGISSFLAGMTKLPSNLLSTFAGPLSGWLTGRGGGRLAMFAGGIMATLGWALTFVMHGTVGQVILVLCIISFGTTMLFTVAPTVLAQAVAHERTSEVSGMLAVVRGMFQGVGAMIVTTLLASDVVVDPVTKGAFPTQKAFDYTLAAVTLFTLLATLCSLALPKSDLKRAGELDHV